MPTLEHAWSWERYVPAIGTNQEEERPFYLLVRSGIPPLELDQYRKEMGQAGERDTPEKFAEWMGRFVKMGDEPLEVNGSPIVTLADYVRLLEQVSGGGPLLEMMTAVLRYNSVEGAKSLFFVRLSGGSAFTGKPTSERAASKRGAR